MTRYLLFLWHPAGAAEPARAELERIARDVGAVHRQLADEGSWVFGGGLHDPATATVVTSLGGRVDTTDGPYVETEEVLGGVSVIDVSDLDAALRWAERMSEAATCPIEVRPFQPGSAA